MYSLFHRYVFGYQLSITSCIGITIFKFLMFHCLYCFYYILYNSDISATAFSCRKIL